MRIRVHLCGAALHYGLLFAFFYGSYHGKSPLNHHLGEYFWNFFPSILSKSKTKSYFPIIPVILWERKNGERARHEGHFPAIMLGTGTRFCRAYLELENLVTTVDGNLNS